jgi:hypothetical protein
MLIKGSKVAISTQKVASGGASFGSTMPILPKGQNSSR